VYLGNAVLGATKNITTVDLKKLGKEFGIDKASAIIDQIKDVRTTYAKHSQTSKASIKMIDNIFK
jgi:hypothetical protein